MEGFTSDAPADVSVTLAEGVEAKATGTAAGTYYMGLEEDSFVVSAPNYASVTLVVNDGYLTIVPNNEEVVVTITGNSEEKTYNGSEQSVSGYSYAAVQNENSIANEQFNVTGTATVSGTNANVYTMPQTEADFQVTSQNYSNITVVFVPGTLTITPITDRLEVTAASDSKTYDGGELANSSYDFTQGVLAEGDSLSAQITGSITNVGNVDNIVANVIITNESGEDVTACYSNIVAVNGTLTITPRPVTITADDTYKIEGQEDPTLTATVTGAVEGETLNYTLDRESGDVPGDYTITVTPGNNPNYDVTVNEGTFTVFEDNKGGTDPNDPTKEIGDEIPDDFQTIFWYVSGGNGTVEGTVYEVHTTENWQSTWQTATKPVANPTADITLNPVNGYAFVNFTASDGKTYASVDEVRAISTGEDLVFTANFAIRTDLSYTVRYLEDGTARELNGAKVVGGQTFGATVTESAINIPGYTMTSDKNPQSITIGTGENVITFYYKEIGPDVEPTPTETPTTPTIPTTPTTPTTPAGPTTPTVPATGGPSVTAAPEATQAPAEEEIQEEETPLAPEAGEGEEETIGEGETPLAGGNAAWALLNLILTILTALGSLILLIGYFIGRNRREEEDETTGETRTEYEVNRHGFWRLVSLIPGIGAIIVFILTEDMSLPMVFVDKWTLLMVIIAVIQIVIAVLSMRNREEPDEDDQANA